MSLPDLKDIARYYEVAEQAADDLMARNDNQTIKKALTAGILLLDFFSYFRTQNKLENGALAELAKRYCFSHDALICMKLAIDRAMDRFFSPVCHHELALWTVPGVAYEIRVAMREHIRRTGFELAGDRPHSQQSALEDEFLLSSGRGLSITFSTLISFRSAPDNLALKESAEDNASVMMSFAMRAVLDRQAAFDDQISIREVNGLQWRLLESNKLQLPCEPMPALARDDFGTSFLRLITQHRAFKGWMSTLEDSTEVPELDIDWSHIGRGLLNLSQNTDNRRRELTGKTLVTAVIMPIGNGMDMPHVRVLQL